MNTPYTTRRARRCALRTLCPHGGRITPGQRVVRLQPHAYVHDGDEAHALSLVAQMCDLAAAAIRLMATDAAQVFSALPAFLADLREDQQ